VSGATAQLGVGRSDRIQYLGRQHRLSAPIASRSSAAKAATRARTGASRSRASMKRSNAPVRTTKPGGTAMPARASSPRLPPLPPTLGRSSSPMSANQPM
jgi:hypothetical protein